MVVVCVGVGGGGAGWCDSGGVGWGCSGSRKVGSSTVVGKKRIEMEGMTD